MNKRNLLSILLMIILISSGLTLSAQTRRAPVRKRQATTKTVRQTPGSKLKTEYNGYKWYETYKYINGKKCVGAKSVSGKVLVPCKYNSVDCFSSSKYFIAHTDRHSCALYSFDGELLFPEELGYDYVNLDENYYLCIKNNTLDVLNLNKNAILRNIEEVKFAFIPYGCNAIKVQNLNDKYGMIDFKGNTIIPYKGNQGYKDFDIEKDYYLCIDDNRLDIIYKNKNKNTKTIPVDGIKNAHAADNNNYIIVTNVNGKREVIDFNGNVLIPFSDGYDDISFRYKNYIIVKKGISEGLTDLNGNTILKLSMGLTDITKETVTCGERLVDIEFWKAEKGDEVAFFTKEGRQQTPFVKKIKGYEEVWPELGKNSSVYFRVKKGGKYGICNSNGKLIIPIKYDFFGYDYENDNFRAYIKNGGVVDVLNVSAAGNVSVKMERAKDGYEYSKCYKTTPSGLKFGVKNAQDQFIIAPEYDYINYDASEHMFEVNNGRSYGRVDQKGNIIIPTSRGYDGIVKIKQYKSWYYKVTRNRKEGICNRYGKELLPPIYSSALLDEYDSVIFADGQNINVDLGDNALLNPNRKRPNYAATNANTPRPANNYTGYNTVAPSTSASASAPMLKQVSLFVVKYYVRTNQYTCETSYAYVGKIGATIALYRNNNTISAPFATGARRNTDTVNGGYKVGQYSYRAIGKPNVNTTVFYYFNY